MTELNHFVKYHFTLTPLSVDQDGDDISASGCGDDYDTFGHQCRSELVDRLHVVFGCEQDICSREEAPTIDTPNFLVIMSVYMKQVTMMTAKRKRHDEQMVSECERLY